MLRFEEEELIINILEGEGIIYKKNKAKNIIQTDLFTIILPRDIVYKNSQNHFHLFTDMMLYFTKILKVSYGKKLVENINFYDNLSEKYEIETFDIRMLNPIRTSTVFYQAGDSDYDAILKIQTPKGKEIKAIVENKKFIISKPDKNLSFLSENCNENRYLSNGFYNDKKLTVNKVTGAPQIYLFNKNRILHTFKDITSLLDLSVLEKAFNGE